MITVKNVDFSKYGFCYVEGTAFCGRRSWVLYNKQGIIDVSIGNKGEFRVNHYNQKVLELIIKLVEDKVLGTPPKMRYLVYVEKETRIRYLEPHKLVKNVAIEKLDGERLRDYFMYWFRADGSYGKCLKIIIKDKWNDNKEIYRGNDYEEFKEKCL